MPTGAIVHRTHAKVFACLATGELTIAVLPGEHKWTILITLVPFRSRLPNSLLWVTWSPTEGVINVEPRDEHDETPMY